MKPSSKVLLGLAILSLMTFVGVMTYVSIGTAMGMKVSSFDDEGPHWPFATMYFSIWAFFLSLVSLGVAGIVRSRRSRGG